MAKTIIGVIEGSASSRIHLIQATSQTLEIDLVDENGEAIPEEDLVGAVGEFIMRDTPTSVSDRLHFTTPDATHLVFDGAKLVLSFVPGDTNTLPLQEYNYLVKVTYADNSVYDVIEWSPADLDLGGDSAPTPPTFSNTVKVDHNWTLPDFLKYVTPGGSPIANAQVRVYYKSDYLAGNLNNPVGITTTNTFGRWTDPVLVLPGYTYTIQFMKPNEFGPDTVDITA